MFIRILSNDVFLANLPKHFPGKENFAILIDAYQVHVVIHVFYGRNSMFNAIQCSSQESITWIKKRGKKLISHRTKVEKFFLFIYYFFFMNNIYCNICSKSPKGSCRELTLFTFNILKIQMHVTFNILKIKMHVKIEQKHIKKRKNKKKKQTNKQNKYEK